MRHVPAVRESGLLRRGDIGGHIRYLIRNAPEDAAGGVTDPTLEVRIGFKRLRIPACRLQRPTEIKQCRGSLRGIAPEPFNRFLPSGRRCIPVGLDTGETLAALSLIVMCPVEKGAAIQLLCRTKGSDRRFKQEARGVTIFV